MVIYKTMLEFSFFVKIRLQFLNKQQTIYPCLMKGDI